MSTKTACPLPPTFMHVWSLPVAARADAAPIWTQEEESACEVVVLLLLMMMML